MKTVFRIFLRDLKRLSRNRAAALVMVGVCLLPSLYAWFNIAANMDPYGNTAGIKVAIANCDRGASSDMISLNAGDTIVSEIKGILRGAGDGSAVCRGGRRAAAFAGTGTGKKTDRAEIRGDVPEIPGGL